MTTFLVPFLLAQTTWVPFESKADGFSILMPAKPVPMKQSTMGIDTNLYIAQAPPFVSVVSRTRLTPKLKPAEVAQMKAAMKRSFIFTSHSEVTGEKAASYAGIPGQLTRFKTAAGGTGAAWIGQKGSSVYLVAMVKQGGAAPAEIGRFFGSFRAR